MKLKRLSIASVLLATVALPVMAKPQRTVFVPPAPDTVLRHQDPDMGDREGVPPSAGAGSRFADAPIVLLEVKTVLKRRRY